MSTILAPLTGCVRFDDLDGPLEWLIHDAAGQRHQAGAWWTDKPGCEPTTHHQRPLVIDGGTDVLRNPLEGQIITIGFDYEKQGGDTPCGRWQIDVVNKFTNEIAALVINTGVRCERPEIVVPPRPPHGMPPVTPPYVPPYTEVPPYVPPVVTPVPEPGTMLLLGGAILARAMWQRMHS